LHIPETIVKATLPALPKLEQMRNDPIPAPVIRASNASFSDISLKLDVRVIDDVTRFGDLALL
jgi:hypothetical protein